MKRIKVSNEINEFGRLDYAYQEDPNELTYIEKLAYRTLYQLCEKYRNWSMYHDEIEREIEGLLFRYELENKETQGFLEDGAKEFIENDDNWYLDIFDLYDCPDADDIRKLEYGFVEDDDN